MKLHPRTVRALDDLKRLWNATLAEELPPKWAELLKRLD